MLKFIKEVYIYGIVPCIPLLYFERTFDRGKKKVNIKNFSMIYLYFLMIHIGYLLLDHEKPNVTFDENMALMSIINILITYPICIAIFLVNDKNKRIK